MLGAGEMHKEGERELVPDNFITSILGVMSINFAQKHLLFKASGSFTSRKISDLEPLFKIPPEGPALKICLF